MNDQEKLTVLWELYVAQHGPYVPPPPPERERLPEGVFRTDSGYQARWFDNGTTYLSGAYPSPAEAAAFRHEKLKTAVPHDVWADREKYARHRPQRVA